jgi:hypothetical protein
VLSYGDVTVSLHTIIRAVLIESWIPENGIDGMLLAQMIPAAWISETRNGDQFHPHPILDSKSGSPSQSHLLLSSSPSSFYYLSSFYYFAEKGSKVLSGYNWNRTTTRTRRFLFGLNHALPFYLEFAPAIAVRKPQPAQAR